MKSQKREERRAEFGIFLLQNPTLFCFVWPVQVGTGPLKSLHLDITYPVLAEAADAWGAEQVVNAQEQCP